MKTDADGPDIHTRYTHTATQIGAVMARRNQPDCAFIGGEKVFTDKRHLYRAHWNKKATTVHISPHWNWKGCEGQKTPVYVYTDGDEAELFLNGRSMGRRRKGEWWQVDLKVVAYKKGSVIGEKMMRTAEKPVQQGGDRSHRPDRLRQGPEVRPGRT